MKDYQDYDTIEDDLYKRVIDLRFTNDRAWKLLVVSAWNILGRIDCTDHAVYETVINGMANAYNAGIDACNYDHDCEADLWDD